MSEADRFRELTGSDCGRTNETNTRKLMSDPEYMKLAESGASYFLPGSVHDEMWRSL